MTLNPNPLPIPDPDQPAEPLPLNDFAAWEARVIRNMTRMATDEAYREKIAQISLGLISPKDFNPDD